MASIINERKNHANFQLIIITHDENFLRKLGQGDVMDYYWYGYPKFSLTLILILGFAHSIGEFLEIHDKNPSSRGRDSAKDVPHQRLASSCLPRTISHSRCIFIPRIHAKFITQTMRCTECINGQNHGVC